MNPISLPSRIFIFLVFLFPIASSAQVDNYCIKAKKVVKLIQEKHFSARDIDEEYALQVTDLLLDYLDPSENIFSSKDVDKIESLSPLIVKELAGEECEFLKQALEIFVKRLNVKEDVLSQLVDYQWKKNLGEASFSMTKKDDYTEEANFDEDIKFSLNAKLITEYLIEQEENAAFDEAAFQEKGKAFVARQRCQYERLRTNKAAAENYIGNAYLSSIASAFDPHTDYHSEEDQNNYMAQIALESYSFGFETDLNASGEIEIVGLVPGSSAWDSNQLNEGDILLSVRTQKGKSKEFSCAETEEAVKLISAMDLRTATFTVKKKSGKTVDVELYKSSQVATENIVQSFILEGEKKIGYIYLPSFYTDEVDGKGSSDAVAKELIKLKREGIDALIFDLRDNGGGGFLEALKISGMFIDYGAVSMTDIREQEPEIYKDQARGKLFSAPLILLQNGLSASASELFAATMQDYNRALIVGSPSFGKSTMQQVLPLSLLKTSRLKVSISGSGYVRTTMGKFYRVTGESHQKEGVQPDVFLPESIVYERFGEDTYPNALEKDVLEKDSYYKPLAEISKDAIIENSKKRVAENAAFQKLLDENRELKKMETDAFVVSMETMQPLVKIMQTAGDYKDEKESPYKAKNPTYLQSFADETEAMKEFNEAMLKNLESNIYVREAYQIGLELISQ